MAHARESIRKAVITALTGLTTTGSRINGRLIHTAEPGDLPALHVYVAMDGEVKSAVVADESGDTEARDLPIRIEARVYTLTDYEDTLDDITAEVETALQANAWLAALIVDGGLVLQQTAIEIDGEGEKPVGLATMDWLVTYRTDKTAPTTAQP
jgi:hypothetical protein